MLKERSETVAFTRDDLEKIARYIAKQQLIGSYIGKFGEQTARWLADGGIEIITKIQEGDLSDLPPLQTPPIAITEERHEKKRKK
jgi:hypothetical protein